MRRHHERFRQAGFARTEDIAAAMDVQQKPIAVGRRYLTGHYGEDFDTRHNAGLNVTSSFSRKAGSPFRVNSARPCTNAFHSSAVLGWVFQIGENGAAMSACS